MDWTTAELAEKAGVSQEYVSQDIRGGRLRATKRGNMWLIAEKDAQGWLFRPQQLIPGAGIGGLIGMLKFLRDGRRNARQYLDKRGLARPSIAWDQIHALWAEIKRAE